MSNHCKTKDEICNLLNELKAYETKNATDISNIYKNVDELINSNSKIQTRLRQSVTDVSEYSGGGKNLDENFIKYIKSIQKRFKKDKNWREDFINEMKYEKISNFKEFKKKIINDDELLPYLISEYEVDFEELIKYPKQQIDRNYLIKAIEKINKKLNLVEKTDIYSISTETLYKHLSVLIQNNKDKIPDKDINSILKNFNQPDQQDYEINLLTTLVGSKVKETLNYLLTMWNKRLNDRRVVLENLKKRVYADNIEYFIKKQSKILKYIYNRTRKEARNILIESNLGLNFFKILTNDGKIEVDDINPMQEDILFDVLRDFYEIYLINNFSLREIHNSIMPIGFVVRNIKKGYDSQFAAIAGCIDNDDVMNIISNKCVKSKHPQIKKFCKKLSEVRINEKNNYFSNERVNIAQQIIRELVSDFTEEYIEYNPYAINVLALLSEQKTLQQYSKIGIEKYQENYYRYSKKNLNLSDKEVKTITQKLKSSILESEYLNPDYLNDAETIYWGDEFTWSALIYIFYKYFGILLIYISGTSKYIHDGSFISWFVHLGQHKKANLKDRAKYALFLNGSPTLNYTGIHYNPMYYIEKNKKIHLFSIDKTSSEYKKYNDTLKDFLDDITYFEE